MIVIKAFCSYCSTEDINKGLQLNFYFEKYPNIRFTSGDDYTHVILVNTPMPDNLLVPKEKVLGLAWEPPYFLGLTVQFIEWCRKNVGHYYIGETMGLPEPFIQHYTFQQAFKRFKEIPPKTKLMSIIFSGKNQLEGHKYRNTLVVECLKRNLPVDVFGYGCSCITGAVGHPRLKGAFKEWEPYDGYQFSIAVENCSLNEYVTEKFLNCLATKTVPVYYGGKNAEKRFPNSFIRLVGNLERDINLIIDVLQNREKYLAEIRVDKYEEYLNTSADLAHHLSQIWED